MKKIINIALKIIWKRIQKNKDEFYDKNYKSNSELRNFFLQNKNFEYFVINPKNKNEILNKEKKFKKDVFISNYSIKSTNKFLLPNILLISAFIDFLIFICWEFFNIILKKRILSIFICFWIRSNKNILNIFLFVKFDKHDLSHLTYPLKYKLNI